jgi:hypothetical protein
MIISKRNSKERFIEMFERIGGIKLNETIIKYKNISVAYPEHSTNNYIYGNQINKNDVLADGSKVTDVETYRYGSKSRDITLQTPEGDIERKQISHDSLFRLQSKNTPIREIDDYTKNILNNLTDELLSYVGDVSVFNDKYQFFLKNPFKHSEIFIDFLKNQINIDPNKISKRGNWIIISRN